MQSRSENRKKKQEKQRIILGIIILILAILITIITASIISKNTAKEVATKEPESLADEFVNSVNTQNFEEDVNEEIIENIVEENEVVENTVTEEKAKNTSGTKYRLEVNCKQNVVNVYEKDENGEYKNSIGLLYGIAFTIKMSYKGTHKIEGFFEYVVPPLEGLWWQENTKGLDYARKEDMHFISMIRLPDFVTKEDFEWAVEEATKKKKQDFSKVEFFPYDEGLCVQCMHIGSYDDEPATVDLMHDYMKANGYELDITDTRYHHEIYLSDPRKCDVSRLKTVVRHPIRKAE